MGSDDKQESTTTGWQPALDAGQNIIGSAGDIYNQMTGSSVPQLGNININSNMTNAWNQMSGSGLNDLANQFGTAGNQMMAGMAGLGDLYEQIGKGPNLYNQQNTAATLLADKEAAMSGYNDAMMSQLDTALAKSSGQIYGQAAGGGNVGSSRTQLAQGQAAGDLASNAQAQMSNLYSQAYDTTMNQAVAQEQARLASLSSQASGILAQGQLGSQMMGTAGSLYQQSMSNQLQAGMGQLGVEQQQAAIDYMNQMNSYNKPMELLGWYNSQVSPWTSASQTTSGTTGGNSMMSGIMGMGSSLLGNAGLFSDKRLKEDIEFKGIDEKTGLNVYSWKWNTKAQELVDSGTWKAFMVGYDTGYIAQEVQEVYPQYVHETHNDNPELDGYLVVDYGSIFNEFHKDMKDKETKEGEE